MTIISSGGRYPHIEAEKQITREIVKAALAYGYVVQVSNDGEVDEPQQTVAAIVDFATNLDDARLLLFKAKVYVGFIHFVYGNSPEELVADHTNSAAIREVLGNHAIGEDI